MTAGCAEVKKALECHSIPVVNPAGQTTRRQFIDMAGACPLFPAGPFQSVAQQTVECSPSALVRLQVPPR
jgi:hypothetical protein